MPIFTDWSNFYVIIGSSAAALTGLMFVVVTLIAGRASSDGAQQGMNVFSTPTVVHFCAAFLVAGMLSAPWKSVEPPALLLALTGITGSLYVFRITHRAKRMSAYTPDLEDHMWYTFLPFIAYAVAAAGAAFLTVAPGAMFALAASSMLLIFIGIHNAWDIVTYLIMLGAKEQ